MRRLPLGSGGLIFTCYLLQLQKVAPRGEIVTSGVGACGDVIIPRGVASRRLDKFSDGKPESNYFANEAARFDSATKDFFQLGSFV
jgi:hypothetical protein